MLPRSCDHAPRSCDYITHTIRHAPSTHAHTHGQSPPSICLPSVLFVEMWVELLVYLASGCVSSVRHCNLHPPNAQSCSHCPPVLPMHNAVPHIPPILLSIIEKDLSTLPYLWSFILQVIYSCGGGLGRIEALPCPILQLCVPLTPQE